MSSPAKNASDYPGVSWNRKRRKWHAYIILGRVQRSLGYFKDRESAYRAHLAAEAILDPFEPPPPLGSLWSVDRLKAARRIMKIANACDDEALEITALEAIIDAL
jgi:hypothetical protein